MNSLLSSARQTLPTLRLALQQRQTTAPSPARYRKAIELLEWSVDGLRDANDSAKLVQKLRGRARSTAELITAKEEADLTNEVLAAAENQYNNALRRCYRLLGSPSKRG